MLIRFNVSNFLSFENRPEGGSEEFSMIAGKVRNKKEHIYEDGKIKLLKFAAVYGANAAGKSNLVKAMDFMRRVILYGAYLMAIQKNIVKRIRIMRKSQVILKWKFYLTENIMHMVLRSF